MIKAVLNPGEREKREKFANVATIYGPDGLQAVMSKARPLNTISPAIWLISTVDNLTHLPASLLNEQLLKGYERS